MSAYAFVLLLLFTAPVVSTTVLPSLILIVMLGVPVAECIPVSFILTIFPTAKKLAGSVTVEFNIVVSVKVFAIVLYAVCV